jgi:hypothetical protein
MRASDNLEKADFGELQKPEKLLRKKAFGR